MIAVLEPEMDTVEQNAEALKSRLTPASVIRAREPLAKRTTLRVGGAADIYVEPATEADLAQTLRFAAEHSLAFFVLGRGSNLLIRDGGVRGIVISLTQPHFSRIEVVAREHKMVCGGGAKLKDVANAAKRNGIAGMEFLEGIPGSVGGALRMNAGAYGGAMFDVVDSLRFMDFAGNVQEVPVERVQASYRSCPFFKTHIAVGAVLKGQAGQRDSIEKRMAECSQKRWSSQPKAPSAGCAFKNPSAIPAGRLVEELKLKGTRVGGAMVSFEHGNFIVTDGTATAADVLRLMALIKERALAERGITLESEVQIIGSDE
ncbi:MAG: UDP-N-acetylmuramate-alanine ligase and UDP-N-acetylmuramate dehydrogenase [Verrucomicrobiota bacterium]|jgi:UDP-N-acetylenolpyruvoylglucosamine reductase